MTTIKKLLNYINNNFLYDATKRERRQVITILIISIIFLTGNKIYSSAHDIYTLMPDSTISYLFKTANSEVKTDTLNRLDRFIINRYHNLQLFSFDPNTADADELEQLGLTFKQINTLLNYRKKGGKFTCKNDFKKLYGIRFRQFQILRPFISLPEKDIDEIKYTVSSKTESKNVVTNSSTKNSSSPTDDSTKKTLFKFDPNFITEEDMYRLGFYTKQIESFIKMRDEGKKYYVKQDFADLYFVNDKKFKELEPYIDIDLVNLLGHEAYNLNTITTEELVSKIDIPEKDAQKIIEMRTGLGGFYSVYQLSDCGIDYNLAKKYSKLLFVAPSFKIKKININDISEEAIKSHPLFNAKQAEVVIKYRTEKGRLMHIEDLRSLNRFDKNELKKIERYFSFK
ncbi:MAG: helix-hairpin-helix domain-containing protein [Bacteroidales bacterium]|nr:helix-hairpin-helix domain-containing protein [Bacteroidales bacterium]